MNQDVLASKKELVTKITNLASDNAAVVICENTGLTVAKISELRRTLRETNGQLYVFKNTLVSRALSETNEGLNDYLTGPNVFVFAKDVTDGSLKALAKFAKRNDEALNIKGGIIDGRVSDKKYVVSIASLPNKEGLVSMLLSVLQAPMRNLAYSLSQVSGRK